MVNALRRMNRLRAKLLGLRHGPGAAILPRDVTRIHMDFAKSWNDGHLGPRRFWRLCLPRLKYWNPAVPMVVNRTEDQAGPATMSIYFREAAADAASGEAKSNTELRGSSTQGESPAPDPTERERVVLIDMKKQHSDNILHEFLQKTGAMLVQPTPEEESEILELRYQEERGAVDRERVRKIVDARRREAQILAKARQEAAALKVAL